MLFGNSRNSGSCAMVPSLFAASQMTPDGTLPASRLSAQADAWSVGEPEPAILWLFGWNLQPLLPPDALDPLVVDHPARLAAQEFGDLAIAVAAKATGQCDDVLGQLLLIVPAGHCARSRDSAFAIVRLAAQVIEGRCGEPLSDEGRLDFVEIAAIAGRVEIEVGGVIIRASADISQSN